MIFEFYFIFYFLNSILYFFIINFIFMIIPRQSGPAFTGEKTKQREAKERVQSCPRWPQARTQSLAAWLEDLSPYPQPFSCLSFSLGRIWNDRSGLDTAAPLTPASC